MRHNVLKVSENFRKMATKSVLQICFFFLTYIASVILAFGLIILCCWAAYELVMLYASYITGLLGLGLVGMGFMILYFLIKFIFSSPRKVDRSHLLEITKSEQPELFKMIEEIVIDVKTDFPKRVYLSAEVNAAVFYDSNFWSMFLPVRKNLQIGLGLMNAVSPLELKAVLAHEFGHFSQRSMKVGSFVYHVNKVIYNMLYENDDYANMLDKWANINNTFQIFSAGAIWVVKIIQKVLMESYQSLNLSYMALSREMEFHADAVAAMVAGSKPLTSALLRLELADQSLNTVFSYYNSKIEASEKTDNFYPQQAFVIARQSNSEELPMEDGLPYLSIDLYKRFNRTKLVLDNQWSSHPSTEERVNRLMALDLPSGTSKSGIAVELLRQSAKVQEAMTSILFREVNFSTEPVIFTTEQFIADYLKRDQDASYPEVYRGYFDNRDPYADFTLSDFENTESSGIASASELFNDHHLAELKSLEIITSDMTIVDRIDSKALQIDTFDYDGKKYTAEEAGILLTFLESEAARLKGKFLENEKEIFRFFLNKAMIEHREQEFKQLALDYQVVKGRVNNQKDAYFNLAEATSFLHTSTSREAISDKIYQLKKMEKPFKEQVAVLLADELYNDIIGSEIRLHLEEYISKEWNYFGYDTYYEKELAVLFTAMDDYSQLIYGTHFKCKKALLEFQAKLD